MPFSCQQWPEILSPIEFAAETINNRTQDLRLLTEARPINLKLLQLKLDGAVLASVNEGPGAIAKAFFGIVLVGLGKSHDFLSFLSVTLTFVPYLLSPGRSTSSSAVQREYASSPAKSLAALCTSLCCRCAAQQARAGQQPARIHSELGAGYEAADAAGARFDSAGHHCGRADQLPAGTQPQRTRRPRRNNDSEWLQPQFHQRRQPHQDCGSAH